MGIERSYDPDLMERAVKMAHNPNNDEIDYANWLLNTKNMMFIDDGNVGLATYEYPGVYNLHWFFVVRGRQAIEMANKMLDKFFTETDCRAIRGLTPINNKAARFLARHIGLTSYGIIDCLTGPHELFCLTKDQFYEGRT